MVRKISSAEKMILDVAVYVLAFLVIIECNSLFTNTANANSETFSNVCIYFAIGILAGLIIYYFIRSDRIRHDFPKFIPVLVAIAVYVLLFYCFNVTKTLAGANNASYLISFLIFLPLSATFFWCKRKTGQGYDLFLKMADLICIYALFSLVTYLTVILRYNNVYAEVVSVNWGVQNASTAIKRLNYYNLVVCLLQSVTINGHSFVLPKNLGFYPEPPMFSLALNTALYTEMYLRKRERRQPAKWVLLTITLLTTQAVLGLMLAVLAWGCKCICTCISKLKGALRLIGCILSVLGIVAAVYLLYRYKQLFDTSDLSSFSVHIEDFKIGLKAFLNKPIWGGGYDNENYLQEFMSQDRLTYNDGFSNTITAVLAEGGIVLGAFCMLPYLIGLLHIFKKRNRETAVWALGMFGCYVLIIFNYHMLLLVMMAYGYSCLYFDHGLKMYDLPTVEEKPLIRWNYLFFMPVCGLSMLIILFGKPVWNALREFLLSHSLYINQSAPKLACFWLLLISAGVVLRDSLIRKNMSKRIRGTIGVIASLIIYGLLYTRIYEFVNGNLVLKDHWSEGRESIYLLLIYLSILTICMLVSSLTLGALRRHLAVTIAVPSAVAVLLIWYHATEHDYYLRRVDYRVSSDMKCITLVNEVPEANLYADSEEILYRSMDPTLKYCATTGDGFVSYDAATVIMSVDSDCTELFNAGWLMTPISQYSVLYTNQEEVISALSAEGYTFYSHYPFQVDTSTWTSLSKGKYLVTYHLHMDQLPSDTQDIGTVSVSGDYNYKTNQIGSQAVSSSAFDENGDATVSLTIQAPECTNVQYSFETADGITCTLVSSTICKTPDYDVRYEYDGRHLVTRESYYDGMGNPVTIADGYAQIVYEYDQNMNTVSTTYEDVYQNPINCTGGYAQILKAYNSENLCIQEAYYSSDGILAVRSDKGYAMIARAYDTDKNQTEEWYYDANGNLLLNSSDFAGWKRTYDEEHYVLSITYYGTDGEPVIMSSGYAEIQYTYDADGYRTSETYYDENGDSLELDSGYAGIVYSDFDDNGHATVLKYIDASGNTTARNDGLAEFHREYDANGRISYESYYDEDGNPLSVNGGYYAVSRTYDASGNILSQKYYDASGNQIINDWGYAEIRWTYNSKNQRITESYYDLSGNPIALSSGQASEARTYDAAGNIIDRKYYDVSGNLVMTTYGYAEISYKYDSNNQVVSETHYDTEGNVIE